MFLPVILVYSDIRDTFMTCNAYFINRKLLWILVNRDLHKRRSSHLQTCPMMKTSSVGKCDLWYRCWWRISLLHIILWGWDGMGWVILAVYRFTSLQFVWLSYDLTNWHKIRAFVTGYISQTVSCQWCVGISVGFGFFINPLCKCISWGNVTFVSIKWCRYITVSANTSEGVTLSVVPINANTLLDVRVAATGDVNTSVPVTLLSENSDA